MGLLDEARDWAAEDPDPQTASALRSLIQAAEAGDEAASAEIADAFAGTLAFGTAGLRGTLGPGPNRMNRVVVSRAAAGLAAHLLEAGHSGRPVVVGFDARHNSDVFARDTVEIMAAAGLVPHLLPRPLPTPVLAFAIRHLDAVAGVMVTASHNPPQDNGYKVYLGDGCQIVPPADGQIAAHIAAVGPMSSIARAGGAAASAVLGDEVLEAYLSGAVATLDQTTPRRLTVVYSAMHGVGGPVFAEALARAGFPSSVVVAEQFDADPDFPTVSFPNPEEPGAMDLALAAAAASGADLAIANDPDADRCAVAIPTATGEWKMLTGDQVGWLLAWWMIERARRRGRRVMGSTACSIVSSTLLGKLADREGLTHHETLTGFKWIARASDDLVFGYEEALGYCVDPARVRDKDGITAALRILEMTACLKAEGRGVPDVLDDLARSFGLHRTSQVSVRVTELETITRIMAGLRADPPSHVGGLAVRRADDLSVGADGLPPTDGLRYVLGGSDALDSARIIIRPSGTEPKVKAYLEVVANVDRGLRVAAAQADEALGSLEAAAAAIFAAR